eukprot:Awhi_evm1s14950
MSLSGPSSTSLVRPRTVTARARDSQVRKSISFYGRPEGLEFLDPEPEDIIVGERTSYTDDDDKRSLSPLSKIVIDEDDDNKDSKRFSGKDNKKRLSIISKRFSKEVGQNSHAGLDDDILDFEESSDNEDESQAIVDVRTLCS